MDHEAIKSTRDCVLEIEFVIKRISFRDELTGFSKLVVKAQRLPKKKKKTIEELELRGIFPMVYEGETFQATGQMLDDFTKGPFFQINGIPILKEPQIEKEILLFFKKRVKGVGVKVAKDIISTLGLDCLKRIRENENCLLAVSNLPPKKAKTIYEEVTRQRVFEELLLFLQRYHLEPRLANLIFQEFEADSITLIKQNPYLLVRLPNVSFQTADRLAVQLGWSFDHPLRVRQAILSYLMYRADSQGDMCVPLSTLEHQLNRYLRTTGSYTDKELLLSKDLILEALDYLIAKQLVFKEVVSDSEEFVYARLYYKVEEGIVSTLLEMVTDEKGLVAPLVEVERVVAELEAKTYPLDPLQREAIFMALSSRFSILTGGPGTGKTATTNAIAKVFEELKPDADILLLAPTGKAAKRMTEVSKRPAMTIHRAIGLRGGESEVKKTISADLVIIDEASMIDAYVFQKLLEAIEPDVRVLLVGDYDQLPSVGAGLILRDLINSECLPVTRLTTIFRQAQESQIVMNSYAAIHGKPQNLTFDLQKGDFYFLNAPTVNECRAWLLASFKKMVLTNRHPIADVCLLSPMRVGELGVDSLNQAIQEIVNPPSRVKSECYTPQELLLREGDRVLHTENNDDLQVFNGEVGTIELIEFVNQEPHVYVRYPDKDEDVLYKGKVLDELELAYCLSIHKSQGSEFPIVISPIHPLHLHMLNRNLIYTAWTRAKQVVICVGDRPCLDRALMSGDNIVRLSRVREKLICAFKKSA